METLAIDTRPNTSELKRYIRLFQIMLKRKKMIGATCVVMGILAVILCALYIYQPSRKQPDGSKISHGFASLTTKGIF